MAQKIINVSTPNDNQGDELRNANIKSNDNFTELYQTKVDKVGGKGLSANDYTTADKDKLAGIPADAEKNVQSDWLVNDTNSDAFIKNKPDLISGVAWGQITGTLSDQADLQNALDALPTYDYVDSKISQTVLSGITDFAPSEDAVFTALLPKENLSNKNAVNGYAGLDGSGKIYSNQLPALAITDTYVVASQAAMLALSDAERGDLAVRTDLNKTFILKADPFSVLANWQELLTPTDTVSSVFGRTGAVVANSGDYTTALVPDTTNKRYQTDLQNTRNDATSSIQTQLDSKAPLVNANLTGAPTAPTAASGTNTTQIATTAFVQGAVSTADTNALHKSGDETFTGIKSVTNTGATNINGLSLTNTASASTQVLSVTNTGAGRGILLFNGSTGAGQVVSNNSSGTGIYTANGVNGLGYSLDNGGVGTGFYINSQTASTGDLMQFRKNGVLTSKINSDGNITTPNILTGVLDVAGTRPATASLHGAWFRGASSINESSLYNYSSTNGNYNGFLYNMYHDGTNFIQAANGNAFNLGGGYARFLGNGQNFTWGVTPTYVSGAGKDSATTITDIMTLARNGSLGAGQITANATVQTNSFVGQNNGVNTFTVNKNGAVTALNQMNIVTDGAIDPIYLDTYNDNLSVGANFNGRKYGGTRALPTSVLAGAVLTGIYGSGYDGSSIVGATGAIRVLAKENFSSTNKGTYIDISTTPVGTTTRINRGTIDDNGDFLINSTVNSGLGKLQVNGNITALSGSNAAHVVVNSQLTALDNAALHKSGDETFTGAKTAINTGNVSNVVNGLVLTNNSTNTGSQVLNVFNNDGGIGARYTNNSVGLGLYTNNLGAGEGFRVRTLSGIGQTVYTDGVGTGLQFNSATGSTGNLIEFRKNNVTTLRVDSEGMLRTSNNGATSVNGLDFTNNGTSATQVLTLTNTSTGIGQRTTNTGAGVGQFINNTNNGNGLNITNSSTGIGFFTDNTGSGTATHFNSSLSSTGDLMQFRKNGTITTKVDQNGLITTITPSAGTNNTQVATTAFVTSAVTAGSTGALLLTGNQTFSGIKTVTNTGTSQSQGLAFINTATNNGLGAGALTVFNSGGAGAASTFENQSNVGTALYVYNNGATTGTALRVDAGSGRGVAVTLDASGTGVNINSTVIATGKPLAIQRNSVDVLTVGVSGDTTAKSFIKSGATANDILMGDGSTKTDTRPYKSYVAILTQTGTAIPVASVLENSLGGTVVWSRSSAGSFTATLTGAFTLSKTYATFQFQTFSGGLDYTSGILTSLNTVNLTTLANGTLTDNANGYIEVRVYN
ncbi:hypothetical protein GKZ90_0021100 [Flavobacterium sp. MC2016-06]|uniref:beta strand repeat-containing protein n=1 Tax=Flavobacterium sp. MC2016-06 TaxID=2676308 RepID=UPI0012BAEC33|nr:hypothetical protein [Flavobacterium sp. MC2016-06]MBU3860999.1 hypothetical protein [Flavobacterium sp. MC2016-06]